MTDTRHPTEYRQQLRERIVDTAARAFATRGIRAVKMDDVARQLTISKRTLYELYDNKEDLLIAVVKRYGQQSEQRMMEHVEKSSNVIEILLYAYRQKVEEFNATVPQFYTDLVKYPRVMSLLQSSRVNHQAQLMQFFQRGVGEGYFRADIDYDVVIFLFDAIGQQVMSRQLYRQYSIEQLFKNLVFTSFRGLCTQKGAEVLDQNLS